MKLSITRYLARLGALALLFSVLLALLVLLSACSHQVASRLSHTDGKGSAPRTLPITGQVIDAEQRERERQVNKSIARLIVRDSPPRAAAHQPAASAPWRAPAMNSGGRVAPMVTAATTPSHTLKAPSPAGVHMRAVSGAASSAERERETARTQALAGMVRSWTALVSSSASSRVAATRATSASLR